MGLKLFRRNTYERRQEKVKKADDSMSVNCGGRERFSCESAATPVQPARQQRPSIEQNGGVVNRMILMHPVIRMSCGKWFEGKEAQSQTTQNPHAEPACGAAKFSVVLSVSPTARES